MTAGPGSPRLGDRLPASRGRDAAGILGALADGTMAALVLWGPIPSAISPTARWWPRRSPRLTRVAVDGFLSSSAALANVVLPAAIVHERSGTTTNIEGRVTRLGQKLVAPGQCWPDWMIASEIAARLEADLGVENIADIWDEIERLAPSHAGITRPRSRPPSARDGIIAPLTAAKVTLSRRLSPEPFDPMATPGIESSKPRGRRRGPGEPSPWGARAAPTAPPTAPPDGADSGAAGAGGSRPKTLRWPQPVTTATLPAPDSYSVRLVSGRRLYDRGVLLGACASLASLVESAAVRAHPHDLEKARDRNRRSGPGPLRPVVRSSWRPWPT